MKLVLTVWVSMSLSKFGYYRAAKVLRFVDSYRRTLSKTYHRLLVVLTADFNSPTISKYWYQST